MTKEYKTDTDKPSEMFEDSLGMGFGFYDAECGWCGRRHYCPDTDSDPPDYEHGDYEGNRKQWHDYCVSEKEKDPDGVILYWNDDAVLSREMHGIKFVIGCPCNGLARYEKFIWSERDAIRKYLGKRIDQEYEWAQQEKTKNALAGFEDPEKKKHYYI